MIACICIGKATILHTVVCKGYIHVLHCLCQARITVGSSHYLVVVKVKQTTWQSNAAYSGGTRTHDTLHSTTQLPWQLSWLGPIHLYVLQYISDLTLTMYIYMSCVLHASLIQSVCYCRELRGLLTTRAMARLYAILESMWTNQM